MATVDTTPKVAYVYNQQGDTWHPVAGAASPNVAYNWTNTHNFNAAVAMANQLIAAMGVNNFANEAERTAVLGATPTQGTISFIRSTNRLEFWSGTAWTQLGTDQNNSNTIVRRDVSGNFRAGEITATLKGNADSATTATSATQLTSTSGLNARTINDKQYNATPGVNFVLTPVTVLNKDLVSKNRYSRIFVRNTTATPGTSSIDGDTPKLGDIYIGW